MKVKREIVVETEIFEVGDIINYVLGNGESAQAMAAKQDGDNMIFCHVDCLAAEYQMNALNTNEGGYDASDLRRELNGPILELFPEEIRSIMVPFENGDLLRIPTEKELFGENIYGEKEPAEVEQWEPMKLRRNRIAFQGSKTGIWEWYWLQNVVSTAYFASCTTDGDAYSDRASVADGVRPTFQVKNR